MKAILQVDPSEAAPLWRQIEDGMRRLLASGVLRPGAPVPSVRDLARDLGVNPNTVVRAYQRLVEAGILAVRRGEGTYVAETAPGLQDAERDAILREGARRFAGLARSAGADLEEASGALAAAWPLLDPEPKGDRT
jgi:GntR family transcriptional regulator